MTDIRRERVRYGTALPNNGVFDGELYVLVVAGADNVLYVWNGNDDAWVPLTGADADLLADDIVASGDVTVGGNVDVDGTLTVDGITQVDAVIRAFGGLMIGSSNGPAFLRARVVVSTAEITALGATPKTLVAGVAGRVAIPLYCAISKTATTAHEDAASDGNLILQTESGTALGEAIEADGFVDDTAAETAFWVSAGVVIPHADAGDALELTNSGDEFTDGGSADTAFVIELLYMHAVLADPEP
jgi:hypothetical protein